MTMPDLGDGALITPDIVEQQLIAIVKTLHNQHLFKLEQQFALPARKIEPFKTVDVLTGDGVRLRETQLPCCLIGLFGTEGSPVRKPPDDPTQTTPGLEFNWQLAAQVVVEGTNPVDVAKRRGWYAMTLVECLETRAPRNELISALEVTDVDFTHGRTEGQRPRVIGEAQITFEVTVPRTVVLGVLPPANTDVPAGHPWGPPADDYVAPAPDPVLPGDPQVDITR